MDTKSWSDQFGARMVCSDEATIRRYTANVSGLERTIVAAGARTRRGDQRRNGKPRNKPTSHSSSSVARDLDPNKYAPNEVKVTSKPLDLGLPVLQLDVSVDRPKPDARPACSSDVGTKMLGVQPSADGHLEVRVQ